MRCAKPQSMIMLCLLAFPGCITPLSYGPIGGESHSAYGYKDEHRPDGLTTILVVVPANSNATLAYEFWERRARELCGSDSYTKNIFRAERATQLYDYYGGRPGDYYLQGYLTCFQGSQKSSN